MTTNIDNLPTDDSRYDCLVDGELSEAQRRELLVGLDNEPGGWRRCALAFLESQSWKRALRGFADDQATGKSRRLLESEEIPARPSPDRARFARSKWSSRLGTAAAMAASFLAVFWMGSLVRNAYLDRAGAPAGAIGQLAKSGDAAGTVAQGPAAPHPWQMVTVSMPGDSKGERSLLSVPAVERDNVDSQWVRSAPSAIPDDVMQALRRTGHQVEQHRELVPVRLNDGRQLVVPVDQVEVHYVGNGTY